MFNLLVSGGGWALDRDTLPLGRALEYTDTHVIASFKPNNVLDYQSLISLPSLFVEETNSGREQPARVGTIISARTVGNQIHLEYAFDQRIPPITNQQLQSFSTALGMTNFEFSRTHWAVKDIDLYKVLLQNLQPRRQAPSIFNLADPERIDETLVSVMMPFHPNFRPVFEALSQAAQDANLRCQRADDIWENAAVIQDVVSLIDRSQVVICDCTGRNPNVFYEAGIAHTLGREVILIAQSEDDIPFDLRHLRFIMYLNNGEGLTQLRSRVVQRINGIIA